MITTQPTQIATAFYSIQPVNTTMARQIVEISDGESRHHRTCFFCDLTTDYDSFPDGSVAASGILACADCLQSDRTREFREAFEIEVEKREAVVV